MSHTAVATVAAVLTFGATPVLIDIDQLLHNRSSADRRAFTPRSKAISRFISTGSRPTMDAITAIAKLRDLCVLEDCAQAVGARYGNPGGSIGDIGLFSFYPTKNLGAIGDGGMMIPPDGVGLAHPPASPIRLGRSRDTDEIGLNSRLDPLQAAILAAKLPQLDADNARRAAIARRYELEFEGLPLTCPATRAESVHAYHLYVVQSDKRNDLVAHLAADQIG